MWQEMVVYVIIALAAGLTAWKIYARFTGKSSCCGGGGGCSGSCQSQGGGGGQPLKPLSGSGCGCGCSR